jgi:hypothetical protein
MCSAISKLQNYILGVPRVIAVGLFNPMANLMANPMAQARAAELHSMSAR